MITHISSQIFIILNEGCPILLNDALINAEKIDGSKHIRIVADILTDCVGDYFIFELIDKTGVDIAW